MRAKKQPRNVEVSGERPESLPSYSDRTYKIADLAVKIMALVPRAPSGPGIHDRGILAKFWDADFEAARIRAEMLLDDIENQRGDVDAYQLFKEGLLLSCEEIAEVFKIARWKGLVSVVPVRKLMRRIELQMRRYGEDLFKLIPRETEEVVRDVLCSLDEIASRDGVREVFPDFMERLNEFIASLHKLRIRPTFQEAIHELAWFEAFSSWCIEREVSGSTQVLKYRAHELFRFAKRRGWEENSLLKASKDVFCRYDPKIHPSRLEIFDGFLDRESIFSKPKTPQEVTSADENVATGLAPTDPEQ